jgi:hypothetical protein
MKVRSSYHYIIICFLVLIFLIIFYEGIYQKVFATSSPPFSLDIVRKKERHIVNVVLSYSDTGIPHGELAYIIRIGRKNLRPYMKRLINKRLVKRGSGKQGRYFPAIKAHRGISITADLLTKYFDERILSQEDEFIIDSPYFKKNIDYDKSELEEVLLNFSNIIGGFITYMLIQSMNAANKIADNIKDNVEKDITVEDWVEDAISLLRPSLLPFFKFMIFPFLQTVAGNVDKMDGGPDKPENLGKVLMNYSFKPPLYTLDDEIIHELVVAFSNLYPNLSDELEKTRTELPRLLANEINHMEYIAAKHKQQKVCRHDYTTLARNPYGKFGNIRHCCECHRTLRKDE